MAKEKDDITTASSIVGDYKYGFKTDTEAVLTSGKGLSRDKVIFISKAKNEPKWMLDFRLKSYDAFINLKNPEWGPDLSFINFDDYTYYIKSTKETEDSWDKVPEEIRNTFDKLGIPEAERKFLAGTSTQFESEVVYHNNLKELEDKGVIFCDTDTAVREHPDLVQKYIGKLVPITDNKYAALNSCVWSGGSFIYVPKGVKLDKPVQSYFRINTERMGQFERTLIIVDDDASIHYVEGCTAPLYSKDSLHAAVVEIYVGDRATCRYSTVQNWSNNIVNLVTKRAKVDVVSLDRKNKSSLITIEITEGRNRQVRKMCEAVGFPVKKLKRISFAGITLEGLSIGDYRALKPHEVKKLYSL